MGETEARTARNLGGGAGESVRCPGMPQRSQRGAVEAQGPVECEKAGPWGTASPLSSPPSGGSNKLP